MTKEQVYEIQNKLIHDILDNVWLNANDKENTKITLYISGVMEMADEIVKLLDNMRD